MAEEAAQLGADVEEDEDDEEVELFVDDDEEQRERKAKHFNRFRDVPNVCAICAESFSINPQALDEHFQLCFAAHLPVAPAAAHAAYEAVDEPEHALFGTYLPAALVELILSHCDPKALGRIYQVNQAWQATGRNIVRALIGWHQSENERLDQASFQNCSCRTLQSSALTPDSSVPDAGRVAMGLLNCLRARSVEFFVNSSTGHTLHFTLNAKPEATMGVLNTARVGDLYFAYCLRTGSNVRGTLLRAKESFKSLVHHDAPLVTYFRASSVTLPPMVWNVDAMVYGGGGFSRSVPARCLAATQHVYERLRRQMTPRVLLVRSNFGGGDPVPAPHEVQEQFNRNPQLNPLLNAQLLGWGLTSDRSICSGFETEMFRIE